MCRRYLVLAVVVGAAVVAYRRRPLRFHPDGSPCAWGDAWVTPTQMFDAEGNKTGRGYACHGCTQEWFMDDSSAA